MGSDSIDLSMSLKSLCRTCSGIQSNKVRPAGVHISLDTGFRRYVEVRKKSIESDPIDFPGGRKNALVHVRVRNY